MCDYYFCLKRCLQGPGAGCCSRLQYGDGWAVQCTGCIFCIIANLMPTLFVATPPRLPPRNLLSQGTSQTLNSMWPWALPSNTCSIKLSYVFNGLFSPFTRLFSSAVEGSILLLLFFRRFSLVANFSWLLAGILQNEITRRLMAFCTLESGRKADGQLVQNS